MDYGILLSKFQGRIIIWPLGRRWALQCAWTIGRLHSGVGFV